MAKRPGFDDEPVPGGDELPAAGAGQSDEIVTTQVVSEFTGPVADVLSKQLRVIELVHVLGGRAIGLMDGDSDESAVTGVSEEFVDAAEEEFHALLSSSVRTALLDMGVEGPQALRISGALQGRGIESLRDVLVAGWEVIEDTHQIGRNSQASGRIRDSLLYVLGERGRWSARTTPDQVAGWCSRLDQVSAAVLSSEVTHMNVQQLLSLSDEDLAAILPQRVRQNPVSKQWEGGSDVEAAKRLRARAKDYAAQFRLAREQLFAQAAEEL